jgi:uncharacterized damage-inducible protein DinB
VIIGFRVFFGPVERVVKPRRAHATRVLRSRRDGRPLPGGFLSLELIRDLFRHQAWADAEQWRAVSGNAAFRSDPRAWQRLHHIHLVQRGFHAVLTGAPFVLTKPEDYDFDSMLAWAREYHVEAARAVEALTPGRLLERASIPWFPEPLDITVEEALVQATMHSHYHRAQNATRLRELGGEPPTTDFIMWLWRGRPEPFWP